MGKTDNWLPGRIGESGVAYTINHIGSMFTLFMTERTVTNFTDAKSCDVRLFGRYFHAMLKRGMYLAPSQFESLFLSVALTDELVDQVIQANEESLLEILLSNEEYRVTREKG